MERRVVTQLLGCIDDLQSRSGANVLVLGEEKPRKSSSRRRRIPPFFIELVILQELCPRTGLSWIFTIQWRAVPPKPGNTFLKRVARATSATDSVADLCWQGPECCCVADTVTPGNPTSVGLLDVNFRRDSSDSALELVPFSFWLSSPTF